MKSLLNSIMYRLNRTLLRASVFIMLICAIFVIVFSTATFAAKKYEVSNYDVEMTVTDEGDFLVEEEITFHFLEGNFSYAYREIEGNNFSNIEFIGIEGIDITITNYELEKGKDLNITWYYNQVDNKASFLFRYKGIAGLQSEEDGTLTIDWTPTGSEWDVPIRDIDIFITLPEDVEDLRISPFNDLVSENSRKIHLHSDFLAAGKAYKIYLTNAAETIISFGILILISVIIGIIIVVFDLKNRKKIEAVKGSRTVSDLSMYEKAAIFNDANDTKKGITAQVFKLAKEEKIKLVSSLKKGLLGSKQAEVTVEVMGTSNLNEINEEIVIGLEKHDNLKKFSQDYKWFTRMDKTIKELMRKNGFISKEAETKRSRTYFSSLLFLIPSITAFAIGGIYGVSTIIALAIVLLIISLDRLIKGGMVSILTPEALYLKENIAEEIEIRKDKLDSLIEMEEETEALKYFFAEIDYIILQKNFNIGVLHRYKKAFKKAKEAKLPDWLELDLSNLDSTLDALEIVEIIDYVLMSMIVIASSTGTTTAGGTGGGTAGGGGGGAG